MKRVTSFLLASALCLVAGCSSAPRDADQAAGNVHPSGWTATHRNEADINGEHCKVCHGNDFRGGSTGVSCFDCHLSGPPFTGIHPWSSVTDGHRTFAATASWTACANANCHGTDLRGGATDGAASGPSCFTASCHAGGPPAPHKLPYTDPADHGAAARNDLTYCRNCHGRPDNDFTGGMVADNNIIGNANGNCSSCHGQAKAHPTNWQGSNDDSDPSYDSSHRSVGQTNIDTNCALCHLTTGPGTGPVATAPSCYSADYTNPDGSGNSCHPNGPQAAPHTLGASWVNSAGGGSHDTEAASKGLSYCQQCHGNPSTGSGARFNIPFTTYADGCETCHQNGFPDGYVIGSCVSCHGKPPATGSHTDHTGIAAIGTDCNVCHTGAGHDSTTHYGDPVSVNIASSWNEKNMNAKYDSGTNTCSGVRCHGGLQTPDWYGVDKPACTKCHTVNGTAYNSPNSGKHDKHVNGESAACTECHYTTLLASVHFDDLGDTTVGNDAASTINLDVNGNTKSSGGLLKYEPSTGYCYLTCHAPFNKDHDPKAW